MLRRRCGLRHRVSPFASLAGRARGLWPAIADVEKIAVTGPKADALLLAGWLRSRLDRDVALDVDEADELRAISVDDDVVSAPRGEALDPSRLLSAELDQFGRDPVYEAAVVAAG